MKSALDASESAVKLASPLRLQATQSEFQQRELFLIDEATEHHPVIVIKLFYAAFVARPTMVETVVFSQAVLCYRLETFYIKRILQVLFWAPIFGLAIFVVPAVYKHNCSVDGDRGFLSAFTAIFGACI